MTGVRVSALPPSEALIPEQVLRLLFDGSRPEHYVAFARSGEGNRLPRVLHAPVPQAVEGHQAALAFTEAEHRILYTFPQTYKAAFGNSTAMIVYPTGWVSGGKHGLPFEAKNEHIAELTCAWADLDVGRSEDEDADPRARMTAGQALAAALEKVTRDEIPCPTLSAFSGRGCYLIWLIRETDGLAPEATPENLARWKGISNALTAKLSDLRADPKASGKPAQPFKAPGTRAANGNIVIWNRHGIQRDGGPLTDPRYTLDQLVEHLSVLHIPTPIPARIIVAPSSRKNDRPALASPLRLEEPPRRHRGRTGRQSATCARRVREIEALINARGGTARGERHSTLYHLFREYRRWWLMENAPPSPHAPGTDYAGCQCAPCEERRIVRREAWGKAQAQCHAANRKFRPPLSESEIQNATQQRKGPAAEARFRGDTIARELRVTRVEVERLGLRAIVPDEIRAARAAPKARALTLKRAAQAKADRLLLDGALGFAEIGHRLGWTRQRVRERHKALVKRGLVPVDGKLLD